MAASTSSATPARSALAVSIAGPIAAGCCAIGAAVYVAALDPSSTGPYPDCVVRSVTGWWCPGCGLTRATHHLLRGDLTQALGYHALVVPVVVLLALTWFAWLVTSLGRHPTWARRTAVPAWLVLAIAAMLFAIARNLPSFHSLRG
jgi:uncharacterized protein DUF2752